MWHRTVAPSTEAGKFDLCIETVMHPGSGQAAHPGPVAAVILVLLHLGEAFPCGVNLSLAGCYLFLMQAATKIWSISRLSTVLTILGSKSRHL